MRRTANYVSQETIKIFDREIEELRKTYDMDMEYIRGCVPDEMKKFTTGVVMMEARRIACRKDKNDLRWHIKRRDGVLERMDLLCRMRKEISSI